MGFALPALRFCCSFREANLHPLNDAGRWKLDGPKLQHRLSLGGLADCHKQRLRSAGLLLGPSEPEDAGLDATNLPGRVIYRRTT